MSVNAYECMFILDSNAYSRDTAGTATQITGLIEKVGGEVLASRLWEERRLAYQITGHRKGTYWLTYFKLDSLKLAEFERACQLRDNIMRHLVLKVDARIADTLVEHTLSGGAKAKAESTTKPRTPKVEGKPEETTDKVAEVAGVAEGAEGAEGVATASS